MCKQWRSIVIQQFIWKKKLEQHFDTIPEWKIILTQHDWHPRLFLTHEENKILFMKISSYLGPAKITSDILDDCISKKTPVDRETGVSLIFRGFRALS